MDVKKREFVTDSIIKRNTMSFDNYVLYFWNIDNKRMVLMFCDLRSCNNIKLGVR